MTIPKTKTEAALDSATYVFTRYGFARTTMGDIAAKAGMSRPALYLVFPDKQAAFDRVIESMDLRTLDEIARSLPARGGLEARLRHACLTWGVHGVELATAHPDAADLFDLRFAAVRKAYANFEALIAELIRDPVPKSTLDAAPEELARTLVYAMRGFRDAVPDADAMRRMISVQVAVFAKALGGA